MDFFHCHRVITANYALNLWSWGGSVRAYAPPLSTPLSTPIKVKAKWLSDWQNTATTNKLRSIKDTITPWSSSYFPKNRKAEVILCRLRIGHTRLTHGHLMEGRRVNECPHCEEEPLTIEHIMCHCTMYNVQRNQSFRNIHPHIKDILGKHDHHTINAIFKFLTLTNLLNTIWTNFMKPPQP